MRIKTEFKFVLPKGTGFSENGKKVSGVMRLLKIKDILAMEKDMGVATNTGVFYVALLGMCVKQLGNVSLVNRRTIEKLNPVDFAFLVDFMNEINHQVIKRLPITCQHCGNQFEGVLSRLGEI